MTEFDKRFNEIVNRIKAKEEEEEKEAEVTQQTSSATSLDDVLKQVKDIDTKYEDQFASVELPEELSLERREQTEFDEDKERESIQTELDSKYNDLKNQTEADAAREEENLNSQKKTAEENFESDQAAIDSFFAEAAKNVSNDAIKRGLARSSIIVNKLSSIEQTKAQELTALQKSLTEKFFGLENEINRLNIEREKSLESLDLQYATEVSKMLNQKISEYEKQRVEILEYNNKIAEIEAKYNLNVKESLGKIADSKEAVDQINKQVQNSKDAEKRAVLSAYFNSMSRNEALDILANNYGLAAEFGYNLYSVLLNEQRNRN